MEHTSSHQISIPYTTDIDGSYRQRLECPRSNFDKPQPEFWRSWVLYVESRTRVVLVEDCPGGLRLLTDWLKPEVFREKFLGAKFLGAKRMKKAVDQSDQRPSLEVGAEGLEPPTPSV